MQKVNACGLLVLSLHQKITFSLRMLCYGLCADGMDGYYRTSESTAMECLRHFSLAIRGVFKEYYMWQPIVTDLEK